MALWLQTVWQKELYSTKLRSPRDNGCPSAYIHRRPTTLSNVFLPVKTILHGNNRSKTPEQNLPSTNRLCVASSDMVARVLGLKSGKKALNQQGIHSSFDTC